MGSHFGVGAPPILVYFSGDWDVHWGYDLAFDPQPYVFFTKSVERAGLSACCAVADCNVQGTLSSQRLTTARALGPLLELLCMDKLIRTT